MVKKKKIGRKSITFDWKLIDEMLEAGSPGTEVAGSLGISEFTLYRYFPKHQGISFSDYKAAKQAKGEGVIRLIQYREAKNGNNNQLIWLGKNRLGQREPSNQDRTLDQKLADLKELARAIGFVPRVHVQSDTESSSVQNDLQVPTSNRYSASGNGQDEF